MSLQNTPLGFRWSLYIVLDGNKIAYAMHENAVVRLAGYAMGYFAVGAKPLAPWSLYLNFNHTQKAILLEPRHFTSDGENLTQALLIEIQTIDPGWQVKGAEPIFEEAASRKRLKISEHAAGRIDVEAMFRNIDRPKELTFYSVMDQVFGKS